MACNFTCKLANEKVVNMAVIAGYIQFNELGKTDFHYINQLADVFNRYKKADVQRFCQW